MWADQIICARPPSDMVALPAARSLLAVLLGFAGMLVAGTITGAIGGAVAGDIGAMIGAFVGIWGSLAGASAVAASRSNIAFRALFGHVNRTNVASFCAIGVALGFAVRFVSGLAAVPFLPFVPGALSITGDALKLTDIDTSSGLFVVVAFAAIVGAPLFEELFFRGVLQPTMQARVGARWAMFLQGLIFASIHMSLDNPAVVNAMTFAVISVCGISLGWIRNKYQALLPCIMAHATFNALAVVVMLATPWIEEFANQPGR